MKCNFIFWNSEIGIDATFPELENHLNLQGEFFSGVYFPQFEGQFSLGSCHLQVLFKGEKVSFFMRTGNVFYFLHCTLLGIRNMLGM